MKSRSFSELYREAQQHQDYWIAGAILEFTESVVREMARQGLTRTALAERLGVTPAYVTKILRGKVNFTLATMVRLSQALDTDLHVRLGGRDRRQPVPTASEPPRPELARETRRQVLAKLRERRRKDGERKLSPSAASLIREDRSR
ncbi:MAG TPA: helix-turn-helix transcriptional regulator [Thermoanaerobaculia bacterium]|nr:helix-turn-helix transcriptional regulator [Thermoanaerobaculia bacterium]